MEYGYVFDWQLFGTAIAQTKDGVEKRPDTQNRSSRRYPDSDGIDMF